MKKLISNSKYEFRNKYYADSNGHIWSESKQDYLTEYDDKNGYKKVVLMTTDKPPSKGHRFSVHRLVMETLLPVEDMWQLQVDHINGNVADNRLENLRWTTPKENLDNPNTKPNRRVYDQDGTHNASASFDELSLKLIVQDINSGLFTRKDIMRKYGICAETLTNLVNKRHYKDELKDVEIIPNFIPDKHGDSTGEKNGRAKLNEKQVLEIIDLLLAKKLTNKQIAEQYGVSCAAISHIKCKDTWTHLTKNIDFD